ncbi:MAG: hypothetical protein KF708_00805 [Pirellulales bacterium]|nr:hypothetical protein [Pirellulales bacterium]
MFRLRPEHMQAMSQVVRELFDERVMAHLREDLPEIVEGLSDDELRPRIERARRRAKQHGLETQQQAVSYIDTCFLLGDDFEQDRRHLWAARLLRDDSRSPAEKADELLLRAESYYQQHGATKGGAP